jgi:hypothetical protein
MRCANPITAMSEDGDEWPTSSPSGGARKVPTPTNQMRESESESASSDIEW